MTISFKTDFTKINDIIEKATKDNVLTTLEFQSIRDDADKKLNVVKFPPIVDAVTLFQSAADSVVEALQKVAIAAKKNKLSDKDVAELKAALEYQLGYIVVGYKSSVERYLINHDK
jgi:hypothetical protein